MSLNFKHIQYWNQLSYSLVDLFWFDGEAYRSIEVLSLGTCSYHIIQKVFTILI